MSKRRIDAESGWNLERRDSQSLRTVLGRVDSLTSTEPYDAHDVTVGSNKVLQIPAFDRQHAVGRKRAGGEVVAKLRHQVVHSDHKTLSFDGGLQLAE